MCVCLFILRADCALWCFCGLVWVYCCVCVEFDVLGLGVFGLDLGSGMFRFYGLCLVLVVCLLYLGGFGIVVLLLWFSLMLVWFIVWIVGELFRGLFWAAECLF